MTASVRIVDAEVPRAIERPTHEVAVGVLVAADARFLMTSRPAGKVYAGYWEFPGGKFEGQEDAAQALRRELQEELGITIDRVWPWCEEWVDYPHALVHLHFCRVYAWAGDLQMREGQQAQWCALDQLPALVLPGSRPVLDWIREQPCVLQRPLTA